MIRHPPPWIEPDQPLPAPGSGRAVDEKSPALRAGIVAVGRDIGPQRLLEAYRRGIFPWYSVGEPVIWWSPDPRMVLPISALRVHRSLRKTIRRVQADPRWSITLDQAFERVIAECAQPRVGQDGTWIMPEVRAAYVGLHRLGHAHSVEVWFRDDTEKRLVGGLYGVSIGRMFFGESMFTRVTDASKIALVALARMLEGLGFTVIDCQQSTRHLAAFGAREIPRPEFLAGIAVAMAEPAPDWSATSIAFSDS